MQPKTDEFWSLLVNKIAILMFDIDSPSGPQRRLVEEALRNDGFKATFYGMFDGEVLGAA